MIAEGIDEVTGQPNTIEVNKADYYQAYYNITESGIYDTSFVKLRDLTLTYQLPKLGIFDISIYGFARNVLIWANLTIGFQGYVHAICLLHLFDYDFLYKLFFCLWNAEI